MDGFSGAAAAAGLLETAIRSLGRLRKAYERVKDAPKVFESYQGELKDIKILVETVDDEESLQTANVHSEVEKLKQIESKLVKWLRTTEEASKRTLAQFSHHLFSGSREEKQLSEMMKQLSGVKGSLCLHIQLSAVGVIRDMENKMVAKLDVINRVNDTLVELLGQSGSLRIAALLQNRAPRSKYL
jgi:DNA repair exonuclease SbcCD ATPase subunit